MAPPYRPSTPRSASERKLYRPAIEILAAPGREPVGIDFHREIVGPQWIVYTLASRRVRDFIASRAL